MPSPKIVVPALNKVLIVLAIIVGLGLIVTSIGSLAGYRLSADEGGDGAVIASPLDASYRIDGVTVTMVHGAAAVRTAGGPVTTYRVLKIAASGDLDGDGINDAAVVLTKDPGGSGTFYYVAAALARGDSFAGTNAVLLGDRIAPGAASIVRGIMTQTYAVRADGEPFTAPPTVGKSVSLRLMNGELRETADK